MGNCCAPELTAPLSSFRSALTCINTVPARSCQHWPALNPIRGSSLRARGIVDGPTAASTSGRCGQSGCVPGGACAAVPVARVLHRRRHDGTDSPIQRYPLAGAQCACARLLSGRRARGFADCGVLMHHRAAFRGYPPQGRGSWAGHLFPVLCAGGQRDGARLHGQHSGARLRGGAADPVFVFWRGHRSADGDDLPP